MKPITIAPALLAILLMLSSGIVAAKPKLDLIAAVRLAEKYVADHKIPNRDRYLASAAWNDDPKHAESRCWSIYWAPINSRLLDAQLVVWVCDDGMIRHQDSWA